MLKGPGGGYFDTENFAAASIAAERPKYYYNFYFF